MLPKFSGPMRAIGSLLAIGALLTIFGPAYGTAVAALGLFGRLFRDADDDVSLS